MTPSRSLAHDIINRADLTLFRRKIQANFDKKLVVNARIIYVPLGAL